MPKANLGGGDDSGVGNGKDGSTTGKDGGGGGDDSGGGDAGDDGGLGVTEKDIPNLPCAKPGGTSIELTAATSTSPIFDRMGSVGTSRFAWSTSGGGMIGFDDSGAGVTSLIDGVVVAGGEPSLIAALTSTGNALSLQRYTFAGATSGSATQLAAQTPVGPTIVAGSSKTLAAWKDGADVVGRMIDTGGGVTSTFTLGTGSGGAAGPFALAGVWSGSDFALVWTRKRSDGKTETSFARVSTGGAVSGQKSLIVSGGHGVVQIAKKTSGFGVLVNEGQPASSMLVVRLDDQGSMVSPTLRLLGGKYGLGIAANGNDLGTVGVLTDGRAVFASFDDTGTPLGRWMCIDDSAGGSSFDAEAAVDVASSGFALLSHRVNGSTALLHVDHVGIGQ